MARTQSLSPRARQQRSYEFRRLGASSTHTRSHSRRASPAQRPRHNAHSSGTAGDRLFLHRGTIGEYVTEVDLFLAVLKSLPTPNTKFKLNQKYRGGSLVVPMLDKQSFTAFKDAFTGAMPRPINYLRNQLERGAPESFGSVLGDIAVKDVIEIGPRHARAVALELDSPQIQEEIERFSSIVDGLHEYRVEKLQEHPTPHITIASFPGQANVPGSVMGALEEVSPMAIRVGEGSYTL